jgi:hypothetical protein
MNVLLTLSKSVSFLVASYIKLKKVFSLILSINSINSLLMNICLEFFKSGYTTLKSHNLDVLLYYLWSRRSCEFWALSSSCSSNYWNNKLALSSTLSRYSDNSCPVITSWIICDNIMLIGDFSSSCSWCSYRSLYLLLNLRGTYWFVFYTFLKSERFFIRRNKVSSLWVWEFCSWVRYQRILHSISPS